MKLSLRTVQGDTACKGTQHTFAQLNIFGFFGKLSKILVRISLLIRLPILGQFCFLTRRATELGPQIESGSLLLWEDPSDVSIVSLGIVYTDETALVHVMNRTVRRCFLFGDDELTGQNEDYRKEWIALRMEYLARYSILFTNSRLAVEKSTEAISITLCVLRASAFPALLLISNRRSEYADLHSS